MKKFLFLAMVVALYGSADAQNASRKNMPATQTVQKVAGVRNAAFSSQEREAHIMSMGAMQKASEISGIENISLNGQKLSVTTEFQAARIAKSQAAAPSNLAAAYKGNGQQYKSGAWNTVDEWDVTPGTTTYQGTTYDVINDILPPLVFNSALDFDYQVSGNTLVFPATAWAQIDESNLAFTMDYTDFKNGGSGAIVLELAEDGTLSVPTANATHIFGVFKATFNAEDYSPVNVAGAYMQCAGLTYTIAEGSEPEPDSFEAIQSYTGKGKEYGGGSIQWDMVYGKDGDQLILRDLVPANNYYGTDIKCSVSGNTITVEPQMVGTYKGYYCYLASYTADDGVLKLNRDEKGHITLPAGEGIIVGAFSVDEFDPTYTSNYGGYMDIIQDVKFYAEDETLPVPAPEVYADLTPSGLLFANMSPSGYSYNANLSIMPAYANMVATNMTSDEATAWAWTADKLKYNSATESYSIEDSYTSTEKNFTFATTVGTYNNITLKGWNQSSESDVFTFGLDDTSDDPYTNFYAYAGEMQSDFEMSDGTFATMTAHNPAHDLKFYTNWGTPDIYSTSMSKIYVYGGKPAAPLYITGITLPLVSFANNGTEENPFTLTCVLRKCTRSATGNLTIGDVIATCEIGEEGIDDQYSSGLTLLRFEDFVVEDEDGMSESIDHIFLDQEFLIVFEGWDNGTFSGVIGCENNADKGVKATWFEKTGAEGSKYAYSSWFTKLFVGLENATYGYLNTEDNTNITLPAEGGSTIIKIEPFLSGEEGTMINFEDGMEAPEWLEVEVDSEDYTNDWYFNLKVSAEASAEGRTATFRIYQPGGYLDITVSQGAGSGIEAISEAVASKGAYNMMGQKVVDTKAAGLYIIDGKKVIK